MATASELLDQWVGTFNDGRPEAFEPQVAANAVSEEVGTGRRMNVAEATASAKAWLAAFPDARGVIENRVVSGKQAVAEIVWRGTNTGSLNGMPPTGKKVQVQAVAVLTEEGGKMAKVRHYIDIAGMLTQLGVMPQPPG